MNGRSFFRTWAIVLALLVAVTGIELVLRGTPLGSTPFLLYLVPVMYAGWCGGEKLGVLTAFASMGLGLYFAVSPQVGMHPVHIAQAALFVVVAVATAVLAARLRASTTRLNAVLGAVGDAVTVQDKDGTLIFANLDAARLIGVPDVAALLHTPPSELLSRFEVFDEEGASVSQEDLPGRLALAGKTSPERLLRFHRSTTKQDHWAMVRANPVFDADGQVMMAVNSFRDVTAQRTLAQAARVSQDWFATTLQSIGDAVITTDHAGRVTFMNPMACRLTGWPSEAAQGAPIAEVLVLLDEKTRHTVPSSVVSVIATGNVSVLTTPTLLVHKTGRETAIDDSAAPIRDAGGALVGVVLVFRDVSEKRQDDIRREFSNNAASQLSLSVDYEGTLKRIMGLAVPQIADWGAIDLVDGEALRRLAVMHIDSQKIAQVEALAAEYPEGPESPTWHILRTGEALMISEITPAMMLATAKNPEHHERIRALGLGSYIAVPLMSRGKAIGLITFAMAESQRRYAAKDLELARSLAERAAVAIERARLFRELDHARYDAESANRAKDEFLAMLGHELRNPLAPISTSLQLMQLREPNALVRERAIIERQLTHVVRLVDDLLDVSRITRGKVDLQRAPQAIDKVIASALEMAGPMLEQRKHTLDVRVAPGLIVDGDAVRLRQIFGNLITNAGKYTQPGGRITITAEPDGERVRVSVQDNGMGIAADMLPRVFDLFTQERQAIDRAAGGLGLGLTIVRSLVELHGGDVHVESAGVGHGSTFVVSLPMQKQMQTQPALPEEKPKTKSGTGISVLVVDDNVDAAELLGQALEMLGYDVMLAHDGPQALQLAAQKPPRVAILDIGLPAMDGYELAERMRELPGLAHVKLAALTGYGQASDREKTAAAGFDLHLVKPVSLKEVQQALTSLTAS